MSAPQRGSAQEAAWKVAHSMTPADGQQGPAEAILGAALEEIADAAQATSLLSRHRYHAALTLLARICDALAAYDAGQRG